MPAPPGPPMVAAAAEPQVGWNDDAAAADGPEETNEGAAAAKVPMELNGDFAAADQPEQEDQAMEQELPGVRGLASHRQAAVTSRMDARAGQLVPYVSLSSEDESSDSKGKTSIKYLNLQY